MINKKRTFTDLNGNALILESELDVDVNAEKWIINLTLHKKTKMGKKLIDSKSVKKSGEWPQSAVKLLLVQEELEILRAANVDITVSSLLQ